MMDTNSTNADWGNATANSLGPSAGILLSVGAFVLVVALACFVYLDVTRLRYVRGAWRVVVNLLRYFLFGVGTLAPLAAISFGAYQVGKNATPGNTLAFLKWSLIVTVAFFLICGAGWIGDRWMKRIKTGMKE